MVASARFTLGGFITRYVFALLVAGATYNPTPYSYYAWAKSTGFQWAPPIVFAGVVLLIGWFICLRLALRSMGGIGLLLANALLASLYWLMASRGCCPAGTSRSFRGSPCSASPASWPSACRGRAGAGPGSPPTPPETGGAGARRRQPLTAPAVRPAT